MKKKIVEKHITVDEETFKKLELICKHGVKTTKRAEVTVMINKKFEEVFPNGSL